MIQILLREKRGTAPWCMACVQQCGPQDEHVCSVCQGFVATFFKCPKCNRIDHFFGHDEKDICACGLTLPSILDLRDEPDARVKYHTGQRM